MNTVANDQARNEMWCSLIPGYKEANRDKKKHMKEDYCKVTFPGYAECMPHELSPYPLDTLPCKTAPVSSPSMHDLLQGAKKKKLPKEQDMYATQQVTLNENNEESKRRTHFLDRAATIQNEKLKEAEKAFGLTWDSPRTPKELIEWIKAGEFTINDDDDEEEYEYISPISAFRWTKIKRDEKGFKAFGTKLDKLLTSTKDAIWAETDAAKLPKILEKFESATIH